MFTPFTHVRRSCKNNVKNNSAIVLGNLQPKKTGIYAQKPINNCFSLNTLYTLNNILSHRLYSRRLAPLFITTHKSAVKYKNAKKIGKIRANSKIELYKL